MQAEVGFHKWHHRAERRAPSEVFPDGCRDVLIVRAPGRAVQVSFTQFDVRPRSVTLPVGTEISGYRLRPGARIAQDALDAIAANTARAEEILGNALAGASETDSTIHFLTQPDSTVDSVSKGLGVSVRTLQRHFRQLGLPSPEYWRLLARARRAVAALSSCPSLAEAAHACGYSDQSHMTRDFMRWFGRTPTQLRRDPQTLALLLQPALGNWTGEQISTR